MGFLRGIDGSEPVRPDPVGSTSGTEEERRSFRSTLLGAGTLACPACDAPVVPDRPRAAPTDALSCPWCARTGPLRDFLSLEPPTRPTRVNVHVVKPSVT